MQDPSTSLVRPALELAWAVARAGEQCRPSIAVPGPLRPLMRFSHLPDRALDTVRLTLDDDGGFRQRVAAAADEEVVGRASWLWLVRPDGWMGEMASAAAESETRSRATDERRAERTARRRLGRVEVSLQRAEAELAEARTAAARSAAELAELRQERRAELEAAGRVRAALAAAIEAATEADRRALAAELRQAELDRQLEAVGQRLAVTESFNEQLTAKLDAAGAARAAGDQSRETELARTAATASALGQAVDEAAVAARGLGHALARAARVLEGGGGAPSPVPSPDVSAPPGAAVPVAPETWATGARGRGPTAGRPRPAERRPAPLPGAVFEDSSDAAAWLVRLPGVVLIVDGYNVTLAAWSARELPDQRHRLVSALGELSMRTGAEVEVVFDGADDADHPLRSQPARRPVRVTFSPPTVEADEVIIERVNQLPARRPVVVATNDRRVRDECRRAGANLLSTEQLVTVLGRSGNLG